MGHYESSYAHSEIARRKTYINFMKKWADGLDTEDRRVDEYYKLILYIDDVVEFNRLLKRMVK